MDLQMSPEVVRVATFLSFVASTACILLLQKKRESSLALRQARRKKKELGNVNIGGKAIFGLRLLSFSYRFFPFTAIFGMDVGGTLTKIVYFEAKRAEKDSNNGDDPFGKKADERAKTQRPELAQRGSSDSLAQLDCPDHKAALEHFYTFMDNNRGTSPRSAVVRDEALSLYSKFLDGKLHFLHFETRNMVDAIKYVSSAAPIENIRSIGCTGGGAHKFAGEFEEELEITFNKFDELECLVRGMHFALNNFPDECFTYRPEEGADAAPLATESSSGRDTASTQASNASTVRITEPQSSPSRAHSKTQAHNTEHTTPSIDEDTTIDSSTTTSHARAPAREQREPAAPQMPKSPHKKDQKEYTRRVLLPFHSGGNGAAAFPYLVVNIGSGVSILKVTGPGKAERVSGTSLGGGECLCSSHICTVRPRVHVI
jgi:type II pantothenate kinase